MAAAISAWQPFTSERHAQFDEKEVQARRDAIANTVLKAGPIGIMILGGDHDLTENVKRVIQAKCEYSRVTLMRYSEIGG